MTFDAAMATLEKLGTAQNRKVYARHGAREPMFGVSYANFATLKKQIGVDHELARKLWASGNHDARVLATMVADPAGLDAKTIDHWAKDLDGGPLSGAVAGLVARSPAAGKVFKKWTSDKNDRVAPAGWDLVPGMLSGEDGKPPALSDAEGLKLIAEIERTIHSAGNRTRYAMNGALIALGGYRAKLTAPALAAAKRIGKVEVDHGETGCKTPDAAAYIRKMVERGKAK